MNEPITTLDTRYSEPDGVVTSWEQTRRVLETAELFWLSTVRTDGRPHVTPVVTVWHDGAIHFSSADTEQKVINLRGNPHVILTTGCNRWEEGLDVVVEGEAVRISDHDRLEQLARVWATRWDGRWQYLVRDGYFYHHDEHEVLPDSILVFSVKLTKVFAFAKGHFSHTRHQFSL
jgi:nitroimidazol reductase NimA-like FMN-containing flavoprotein (pyridoxamine 5'-phosphate oxidase superfamily)